MPELPSNTQAEMDTVGALMVVPEMLPDLRYLDTADFYDGRTRLIFVAIKALETARQAINPNAVADQLERTGHLAEVGGPAFLTKCWNLDGSCDASRYAPIVKDFSLRRKMLKEAQRMAARALQNEIPLFTGEQP
ncbi:MAG: DnaB-like helicase N-terminal domain-containing protein [Anaerolineales bacterium]